MKETFLQYFEWYLPETHTLWKQAGEDAQHLADIGITGVWFPPAYKGQAGDSDVGYGVYDRYDLGEFCAKGSVETKYGTKDEYIASVKDLQKHKIGVIADIVLNHMMGSETPEDVQAVKVKEDNREETDGDYYNAKVWTKFTFPQREGKYSDFTWNWEDFTGTDYDQGSNQNQIMKFEGKEWSENVSKEQGNFDYIMGDDIDFSVPEVITELYKWGIWYTETTGINGFRLDAVKSIDAHFYKGWLEKMKEYGNHPSFAVGEYWSGDLAILLQFLKDSGHCMKLFDVPLHFRLQEISNNPDGSDLRTVFQGSLFEAEPEFACVFSDNHDTQPGQALESWVQEWFKPISYALLLLRDCKYPCVFYGDLYGIEHNQIGPVPNLEKMIWIRKNLLSGAVTEFNDDDPQKTCWLAPGEHPVIVVASIGGDWKSAAVEDFSLASKVFVDVNEPSHEVCADENGRADFTCLGRDVTVYILKEDYPALENALNRNDE